MTSYTVTIAPDDPDLAVTTIRLDVTEATASIQELRLVPGTGGGLLPGDLPVLDLNNLVAAVVAAVAPGSGSTTTQSVSAVQEATTAQPSTRTRGAARARSAEDAASSRRTQRKAVDKNPEAKPTKAAKAAKAAKPAKKAAAVAAKPGVSRTYRRVPDDFDQVLRQAGESAAVIADHYEVPRHTAYSWIRSARKRGAQTS